MRGLQNRATGHQEPLLTSDPVDAEALRRNLEKSKLEAEKMTLKNAASNEYVTRAFAGLQAAKQDADRTNDSECTDAAKKIGPHQGSVDTAVGAVDQISDEVQKKKVPDLEQRKTASETKLGKAQNSLAAAQAGLQKSLAYQAKLTAALKAVADLQAKIRKVNDPARAAEFYFYTTELKKKLSKINVKGPDELIDVSVDLDAAQKQLADLENKREAQILAKIRPYNQDAARPSQAPATK